VLAAGPVARDIQWLDSSLAAHQIPTMLIVTGENLHSAYMYGQPLGVRCPCGHRSLLPLELLQAKGSMRPLRDLRLKCSQCNGRAVELVLFFKAVQADAFWEGQDYADVWDLRLYGDDLDAYPAKLYKDGPNPFREVASDGVATDH
jgi:hypothetical protein